MDQEIPTTVGDAVVVSHRQEDDDDDDLVFETIRQAVSRRQPIHSTEDDPLDPIEWTVRKLIPIPETYYWDYTPPPTTTATTTADWQAKLPWHVKAWHGAIGAADVTLQCVDRWIAQPIASAMGLTAPRMSYVTDHMTEAEWAAARQRLQAQQQRRIVLQDGDGSNKMVVTNQHGKPVREQFVELESNEIPTEER